MGGAQGYILNLKVFATTDAGLDGLTAEFSELLKIIRVYVKPPGKPADMNEPFTLPTGSTVMDLSMAIHHQ